MNQRRVFLKVLGASALASACNSEETDTSGGGTSATGTTDASSATGVGGSTSTASSTDAATSASGAGGGSATSTSTATSTATATSTSSGGGLPANYTIVGKVSDIMTGFLKQVSGQSLLLGQDAGGIYAMSSLCTHKFCDMTFKGTVGASGITCTCHASKFDNNGAVTKGPAVKALDHFDCAVDASGNIGVDKTKVVDASFRAMVM